VHAEEERTKTQEIPMEKEIGQETGMDTQMPKISKPLDVQRKRTRENTSVSRKAKAHRTPLHTSLTVYDVELVATIVQDRLSKVWENIEKHRDSILEQVQELKNTLD